MFVVVGALDVGRRHDDLRAHRVDVDQQVADLALLGNLEVGLVRVEVARDLGVGRGHLRPEAVGGEADDRELHLVVAAAVLLLELLVGHRQPVGERRAQLLDDQAAPHVVLELGRRSSAAAACAAAAVALLADERAVLLERGNRENALRALLRR